MTLEHLSTANLKRIVQDLDESDPEHREACRILAERQSGTSMPKPKLEGDLQRSFSPTKEQLEAVGMFKSGVDASLIAFAGAGKTSTLELIAGSTSRSGLYLAFNTVTAAEARQRFPKTVECLTTHALARRSVTQAYSRAKLFRSVRPRGLKRLHNLGGTHVAGRNIDGLGQAFLTLKTVSAFCQSADTVLSLAHVPTKAGQLQGYHDLALKHARGWVLEKAKRLWEQMLDPKDATPLGHDGYLKVWSLSKPILTYDYILLDEAQDTNPCVTSVLQAQTCQIVYVGDPFQQIYEWRGAVNAMGTVNVEREARLSQTFRFGGELAAVSTDILRNLGETTPLRALPGKSTTIAASGKPNVLIARKNATLIEAAMELQGEGKRVSFVGVRDDLLNLVGSVFDLKKGKPATHPDLVGFTSWDEVVAHSQLDEGEDLRPFVKLVREHGERYLYRTLKSSGDETDPHDMLLTSGHRAKGREWSQVEICTDFADFIDDKGRISESEGRLFYVAITRAKDRLVIDPALLLQFRAVGRFIPDEELRLLQEAEAQEILRSEAHARHTAPEPSSRSVTP